MLQHRLDPIKDKLRCPECGSLSLVESDGAEKIVCVSCESEYPIVNGCPLLLTKRGREILDQELKSETGKAMQNEYSRIGMPVKRTFLSVLASIITPPQVLYDYNPGLLKPHTQKLFSHNGPNTRVLNVGGGPSRYSDMEIAMNLHPFYNVDLVGDAHNIPFHDESFDSVICNAVLEHVHEPDKVVAEMMRVLKKGGMLYAEAPFIFFFHGYPSDYTRYTIEGMKRLFSGLESAELGMTQGPVSAWLQSGNMVVEIIFGSSSKIVRKVVNGIYRWLFFWLKYIDIPLERNRNAYKLACGFYVIGRK